MNTPVRACVVSLLMLTWGAAPSLGAAEKVGYTAVRLPAEPEIDGLIDDDPAWAKVAKNQGAFYIAGSTKKAPLQTSFRVGYTAKGIYFGVVCNEPNTDNMKAEHGDMGPLWGEDSVEVFISPPGTRESLHLIVNAIGSRFNESYAGNEGLMQWEVQTFMGDDSWSAEVFIPYGTIATFPKRNAKWELSICRTICSLENKVHSIWTQTRVGGYQDPSNLRPFTFSGGLTKEEMQAVGKHIKTLIKKREAAVKELLVVIRRTTGMYVVRPGGSSKLIARLSGTHVAPRLMPDLKQVLFQSNKGGRIGIWRLPITGKRPDIEGTARERVCDGEQVACALDGKRIVFRRNGAIVERDLATGNEKTVSPDGWTKCRFPEYLPDGRVAFVVAGVPDRIYVTGSERQQPALLLQAEIRSAPRCSPDGKWLAYQDGAHIWLFNLAAKTSRQFTTIGGVQSWPVWSSDAKSLCFCQTFDSFSESHILYHVLLGKEQELGSVVSKIEGAPDWSGVAPKVMRRRQLPVEALSVSSGPAPLPLPVTKELFAEKRFQPLPVPNLKLTGEIVIQNRQTALCISAKNNKLLFVSKAGQHPVEILELLPFDAQGRKVKGIKAVSWREQSRDRVAVHITFNGEGKAPAAVFVLPRARPTLTVQPGANWGGLAVKASLSWMIATDRAANDLLFTPAEHPGSLIEMPYAPVWFGGFARQGRLLMVVTPVRAQTVELTKEKGEKVFSGLRIRAVGKPVHIAIMPGSKRWEKLSLAATKKPGEWKAAWKPPFKGQWRVALRAKSRAYSSMISVPASLKEMKLPVKPEDFQADPPALAFVYPYGRNPQSYLGILTPMDILYDAMGLKATEILLDSSGLRKCRVADAYSPFKNYRVTLKVISWITISQDGASETVQHLCDDLINMMRGLDSRIGEYQALFGKLGDICGEGKKTNPQAMRQIAALERLIGKAKNIPAPATPFAAFKSVADKLKQAAKHLGKRKEHNQNKKELSQACDKVFAERIQTITLYRRLAKEIRDRSGLAVTAQPKTRKLFELLRETVRSTLRDRYFLEADWRGENPLNPEEVDYEKIKKM